jgi:hypothetical protein
LTPRASASFSNTSKSMPEVFPFSMLLMAGRLTPAHYPE